MNRVNTILIGALVAQICLALLMQLSGGGDSIGEPVQLVEFDKDTVTTIEILAALDPRASESEKQQQERLRLVKNGDAWELESHFGYPAETGPIEALLDKIASGEISNEDIIAMSS